MNINEKKIIEEVHHYDKTEFPFTFYSFDENTTDYIPIPMHFHEEIEIIYFQKGNATYRIDFSDYFVDSETIIIINKNSPHSIKKLHTEKTKGYIYLFNPNILEGAIDDFCTSKYIAPLIEKKMDIMCCINQNENFELFEILKNILLDMSGEKSSVMEELLSLQRRHYERLDISQRELQSLRHDIKNHISCLYALLDSGHAKEAKEYIKELYTCNKGLQGIIYSGNIVIDSILSNGLANLENRGINLKCSIIIPPSLNIADVDLCILFGNLIDNAVEACERIVEPGRKKFIVLNVNIKKDYLFIDIANSFTGEVKKQNNIYRTVKIDERYCGIGLFNIRKIVEKYNGEFSVSHSDNVFSVSVMLSLLWGKK